MEHRLDLNRIKKNMQGGGLAFVFFVSLLSTSYGAELYVAPGGDDSNPGTKAFPYKTLTKAQTEARALISSGLTEDLFVVLREGRYELSSTMSFTSADADSTYSVTWMALPGETVRLSGGRVITGWTEESNGSWKVHIPDVQNGSWYFRQLFVNDSRATRSRYPNNDGTIEWTIECQSFTNGGANSVNTCKMVEADGFVDQANSWAGFDDIEIVILRIWSGNRKFIDSFNASNRTFTLEPPHSQAEHFLENKNNKYCYFENSIDFLDESGEFFLDKSTGWCTYLPHAEDGDVANAEIIAPVVRDTLIQLSDVTNFHFRNITFEHCDFDLPRGASTGDTYSGWSEVQGGLDFNGSTGGAPWKPQPAALLYSNVKDSSVIDCRVLHVENSAIRLQSASDNNLIKGCEFGDLGGGGLEIKYRDGTCNNNVITNCVIHDIGQVVISSHPVFIPHSSYNSMIHNEMHSIAYGGPSIGWWGGGNNYTLSYNHIHNYNNMIHDTGGIYTLGALNGTLLEHNHMHDGNRSANKGWSRFIFFDEYSGNITLDDNIGYDVHSSFVFNKCAAGDMTWAAGSDPTYGNNVVVGTIESSPTSAQKNTPAYRLAGLEPQWRWLENRQTGWFIFSETSAFIADGFETGLGNWTSTASSPIDTSGNHAYDGTDAAVLGNGDTLEQSSSIDLSSYDSVTFKVWFKTVNVVDSGETLDVEFYNGSAWETVGTYTHGIDFIDGVYYPAEIIIPSTRYSAGLPANGKFRVTLNAGSGDVVYLDEISINNMNNAPVASDDDYPVLQNNTLSVSAADGLLANDSDTEGDSMTAELVKNVTEGTLTLNANGSFDYTPPTNYMGVVSFYYRAITGTNKGPVAEVQLYVHGSEQIKNGNFSNGTPGPWMDPNWDVADWSRQIETTDNNIWLTDGTADPVIGAGNQAVKARWELSRVYQEFSVTAGYGYLVSVDVMASGSNSRWGPLLRYEWYDNNNNLLKNETLLTLDGALSPPNTWIKLLAGGIAPNNAATCRLFLDINSSGASQYRFLYFDNVSLKTTDPSTGTPVVPGSETDFDDSGIVDVLDLQEFSDSWLDSGSIPENLDGMGSVDLADFAIFSSWWLKDWRPVASPDTYNTSGTTMLIETAPGILNNDSDPLGIPLSAVLVTDVSNGTLNLNPDGSFTYTANAGFSGTDSFTYKADNGTYESPATTVTINVAAGNLLRNSDFEVPVGGGAISTSGDWVELGTKQKIQAAGWASEEGTNGAWLQGWNNNVDSGFYQDVAVTAGTSYTLDSGFKVETYFTVSGNIDMELIWLDIGGSEISRVTLDVDSVVANDGQWSHQSIVDQAPASAVTARCQVHWTTGTQGPDDPRSAMVDNMMFISNAPAP